MNIRIIISGLGVGAVVVGFLVWLSNGASNDPSAQQAVLSQDQKTELAGIKVGVILPLSGPFASQGLSARSVMEFAIDQVNSSGGVEGRRIELMFRDGECRSEAAAAVTEKLASTDKVRIFIGGFCTEETIGMMPVIVKYDAFLTSPYSPGPLDSEKSPYFVSMYPSDALRVAALQNLAVNVRQIKKIAILESRGSGAQNFVGAFKEDFARFNGEVTSTVVDFQSSASLEGAIESLRSSNPGALYVHSDDPVEIERVFKSMRTRRWFVPLILSLNPAMSQDFVSRNTSSLEGSLVFDYQDSMDSDMQAQFIQSYIAKNANILPPSLYGAYVQFDTVFMLANAMNAVGEEPMALADWFRSIRGVVGLSGPIIIGLDGARAVQYLPAIFKKGAFKTL